MLILNVDDDIDDREMFLTAVNAIDPNICCIQFESGSKLLEYMSHPEPNADFLFIDINMPKMSGYECVERLKLIPSSDHLQIVMYSTAFNPKLLVDFKNSRVRYLSKTSRLSELIDSIKTI